MEFSRARSVTPEVAAAIEDAFDSRVLSQDQLAASDSIRHTMVDTVKAIIDGAPPCADRTRALGKMREAWADVSSAIAHNGRF